ncbi:unnamed protein product [Bursaphelenchus xylophilus]|uniref:(pine wood nematode) hypothetical protein n=1 Tax=Bursaphelenchus xylophilus TaxID=6326 RepID=A0A1I7RUK2_BURXY|nr:unnamed protein product [Bursaphelenchus xylophilus]CAG9114177.1 unnamed protein product [Bursaphelenchus xylophilus]
MTTNHVEADFNVHSISNTLFMCSLYIVLGTVAMIANLLNILIFLTHRDLRTNHVFFIALDFGEMINGLSYVLTGIGRGTHALRGDYDRPITVHECFFQKFWPIPLILGTEIPALMTLLQSAERVIAVEKPSAYNQLFSADRKKMWIGGMAMVQIWLLFGIVMHENRFQLILSTAAASSWHNQRVNADKHCAIISSTAGFFSTFHFIFIVMAYMLSFCSLYTIHHFSQRRKSEEGIIMVSRNTKADHQLTVFLVMTAMDIVLVTIPGVVMLGAKWQYFAPNDLTVALTYSTTGFISLVHIFINYYFNELFRKQVQYWKSKALRQTKTTSVHTRSFATRSSAKREHSNATAMF